MKKFRHSLDTIQKIVRLKAAADKANKPRVSSLSQLTAVPFFQTTLTGWVWTQLDKQLITFTAEWQCTRRGNEVMKVYPVQFCKSLLCNGTKITFTGTVLRGPGQTSHLGNINLNLQYKEFKLVSVAGFRQTIVKFVDNLWDRKSQAMMRKQSQRGRNA